MFFMLHIYLPIDRVDKKRDKIERKILDSQERAFWDVHRPVVRVLTYVCTPVIPKILLDKMVAYMSGIWKNISVFTDYTRLFLTFRLHELVDQSLAVTNIQNVTYELELLRSYRVGNVLIAINTQSQWHCSHHTFVNIWRRSHLLSGGPRGKAAALWVVKVAVGVVVSRPYVNKTWLVSWQEAGFWRDLPKFSRYHLLPLLGIILALYPTSGKSASFTVARI